MTTETSIIITRAAHMSALGAISADTYFQTTEGWTAQDADFDALADDLGRASTIEERASFCAQYVGALRAIRNDAIGAAESHVKSGGDASSDEAWGDSDCVEQWASIDSRAWSRICRMAVKAELAD